MLLRIFNFDLSTASERINMQQFICNETYVNIISWLAILKFSLITLLANMIKYQRCPAVLCNNLCLRVFLLLDNTPETVFDYVMIKIENGLVFFISKPSK